MADRLANKRCFLLETLLIVVLLFLASCGGGSHSSIAVPDGNVWPEHNWERGVSSGPFTVVAVDSTERVIDPLTGSLELVVDETGSGATVTIVGNGLDNLDHAYLHLKYDPAANSPVMMASPADIRDDVVFLGITSVPGLVSIGMAAKHLEPILTGDRTLAEVRFSNQPNLGTRQTSKVTSSVVDDLRFSTGATLTWSYASTGDYSQDSEVGIADVTPVGQYWKSTPTADNWQQGQVADGDLNDEVNINDLTPIGQHYQMKVSGYKVQGGAAEAGPFADDATVAFNTSVLPDGGGFKVFNHTLTTPVENAWYVVVAMDGTDAAAEHSNPVQYTGQPTTNPPVNLTAFEDAGVVKLEWSAPASGSPDGYIAYRSDGVTMITPQVMNVGLITGTTFDCPVSISTSEEHYFAVTAMYGSDQSSYSNIYHYEPGGNPPLNLIATNNAGSIVLDWDAPAAGSPSGYDAYVSANSDMSGDQKLNIMPIEQTTFTVPLAVSPDEEHYFAVKARYGGTESGYSNIAHYDPSAETDPPVWTGNAGIESATPGNGQVTVTWYEATDAGSPPVTYVVYHAALGSFDWTTATTTQVTAPTQSTVIGGLANGTTYVFGVRARDSINNTDTNTNTLQATPSSGSTPVDSGIWQESELIDDGGALPSQDVGWFSDIEVKDDGTIGIAHHNESSGDLMYSYQLNGTGNWTTVTVTSQGQTGSWCDLEFHPVQGYPCIAYHNEDDAALEYAWLSGSTWNTEVVESGGDKGAFASLEFDPTDNNPAIAYFDAIALDVKYAKYNGTSWDKSIAYNGTPGGANLTGAFCDLAFNPVTNRPGIAFMRTYDFGGLPQHATWITEYNGTAWSAEAAIYGPYNSFEIDTAGWANSLCYTPTGTAIIITCELMGEVLISDDSSGGWDPTVHNSVGSTGSIAGDTTDRLYTDIDIYGGTTHWVYYDMAGTAIDYGSGFSTGAPIETGGNGGFPALAIGSDGTLYASYLGSSGGDLKYAVKPPAGAWTINTAENGTGGMGTVGEKASLAFHPTQGYPVVSYYDASNSALKFADKQTGSWRTEIVSNLGNDGGASQMGIDSAGNAYIGFFSITSSKAALKIANGAFGTWSVSTILEADFTVGGDVAGNYCSLGMNYPPLESPGIAYHNTTQRRLEFAQLDSGGGSEITTVAETNDPGRWNSVAYNSGNKFAGIATYVRDTQDLYFVQRSGSGAWAPVAVDTAGSVGNRCSLVYGTMQTAPRPWISYYDESNHRLKVAYVPESKNWDDVNAWSFVEITAPGGSTDYGTFSSIAWHPTHNRPAVVFFDSNAGKLWYVFIGDPAAPQAAVEVVGDVNIEGTHASLVFTPAGQPAVAYHDVSNGDLRYVTRIAD